MTELPQYSVVIPVYNSEKTIRPVVDGLHHFFFRSKISYEIILVNDGSTDGSWQLLKELSAGNGRVLAIDLLKNYGQHNANLCGFRHAKGEFVITMDDDLQNPPEEISKLREKAEQGHDLVIGKFAVKQHGLVRRLGSKMINEINGKVFSKPKDFVMSNFRLIRRDIVERVCAFRGTDPYIPGLVVSYASRPANVVVEHSPRRFGKSNYNLAKLLKLVFSLLFNYSIYPLRFLVLVGGAIAAVSFVMGLIFLIRGLLNDVQVSGWTSIATMLSFFSGFIILLLGVLGEYIIRITKTVSQSSTYYVREIVKHEK